MADLMPNPANLNNQTVKNFDNTINIGSLNNNVGDFSNINRLDDFISSEGGDSGLLKGAIEKIQTGQAIDPADMEGLSNENRQLIQDLQSLIDKPSNGFESFEGVSAKEVADGFSNLLDKYLNNVNEKKQAAANAVETFASGGDIDIHSVMIASEKASLSMQLAIQLKSKLLNAYKEISSMRV